MQRTPSRTPVAARDTNTHSTPARAASRVATWPNCAGKVGWTEEGKGAGGLGVALGERRQLGGVPAVLRDVGGGQSEAFRGAAGGAMGALVEAVAVELLPEGRIDEQTRLR